MKRVRATISGRVQGVWYRQSTANEANRIGVAGWVRNLSDGSVEAVFEGEGEKVAHMLSWCRMGPPLAKVTKVDEYPEDPEGLVQPFRVLR